MGTFERLSVLVIGVILVMILVVALVTWTDDPAPCSIDTAEQDLDVPEPLPLPVPDPAPAPAPLPEVAPSPPPAPEPAVVEPAVVEPRIHVVNKGETLILIARRYYKHDKFYREIMRANDLETPLIRPGQALRIPPSESLGLHNEPDKLKHQPELPPSVGPVPGASYTVRPGEDLPTIAKRAYDDMERWIDIWYANRAALPDPKVRPEAGTVLRIP